MARGEVENLAPESTNGVETNRSMIVAAISDRKCVRICGPITLVEVAERVDCVRGFA